MPLFVRAAPILVGAVLAASCSSGTVKKGQELLELNMHQQAIDLLEAEIKKDPQNADAYRVLGHCYGELAFINRRDASKSSAFLGKATEAYSAATKLKPDWVAPNHNLGVLLDLLRGGSEAIGHLERAMQLHPSHHSASAHLLNIYLRERSHQQHARTLATALFKDPPTEWRNLREAPTDSMFVVLANAPLFLADSGKPAGRLAKFACSGGAAVCGVIMIERREGDKCYFVDTINRDFVDKQGYVLKYRQTCRNTQENRCTEWGPKEDVQYCRQYVCDGYYNYKTALGALYVSVPSGIVALVYDVEDKLLRDNRVDAAKIGQIRVVGAPRTLILTNYGRELRKYSYDSVRYKERTYPTKWVACSQLCPAFASTAHNGEVVSFVRSNDSITESIRDKLLCGFVAKGITASMTHAAVGYLQPTELKLRDDRVSQEWQAGAIRFSFLNGRLASWRNDVPAKQQQ